MNKELYVSVTPHETKVALLEDDSLAEVYFERENEYTLAGSIYKGRVTRVLPGMQSAFVDIGLERDAFLYVSDFLELGEDEDEDGEFGEVKVTGQTLAQANGFILQEPEHEETEQESETAAEPEQGEQAAEPSTSALEGGRRWRGRRRRRGRRGGRDRFGSGEQTSPADENKEAAPELESSAVTEEPEEPEFEEVESEEPEAESVETIDETPSPVESVPAEPEYTPLILPGESIARYNRPSGAQEETAPEASETREPREGRDRDRGRRGRGDRDRGRGRDRERGDRSDRGDRGSREEYVLPENYTPIVLPGESISKYRGIEPISTTLETEPETTETEKAATEPSSAASISQTLASVSSTSPSETTAPESSEIEQEPTEASASVRGPEWTAPYSATKTGEPEVEEEPQAEDQPEEVKTEEVVFEQEPEAAEAPVAPTGEVPDLPATAEIESATEEEAVEELEVPAAPELASEEGDLVDDLVEQHIPKLGIPVPEPPAAESQPEAAHADLPEPELIEKSNGEKSNGNDRPSSHQPGSYVIEGGNVEHEELDAEEADEPSYSPQLGGYRHEPTEDTEESERNGENGAILGDTVRDTEEEEALEDSEYEFGGDEFEESEMLAEEEGTEETEAEEETAEQPQAESGQRERGFDRGRRGRRPMGRHMRPRQSSRQVPQISELLKEGQEVLVQIAKEPIGKKGARITSHIALPGRFLVYMPTVNHIGVSRKISSDDERQRLKRIVSSERENGHGGFIVRTAAANIKEDELRADIRFLKHLWHEIRTRAEKNKAPSLIYHDLNLVERILRDQVTSEFSQIWVDSEQEYERVVRFASRFQPNLVRRIKLYTKETPLYEQFGISEEINKSLKSKVWLKSGGYIVINQTEALVAIDINTGKYVGKTTRLEDTIVKTNCDAVKEIVRQIRLRDLGGIIVIDFIDMDERKNRQKVMQALEEALKADRAPSKVLQFNDFGLVAITRKRVKQSLERTLGSPCPYCEATGFVKSVSTVCNEIFVEMRKIRNHVEAETVTIRVNPEVAKELKSNNGKWIQEIEEMIGQSVLIKSDAVLHQEKFDIQF